MDVKNWFVPSIAFCMFIYAMIFLTAYTYKIGGEHVSFYAHEKRQGPIQNDVGVLLKEISKNFGK